MADYSHEHLEYRRRKTRWMMASDFWRGGAAVLRPDHPIYRPIVGEAVTPMTGVDAEPNRDESIYEWRASGPAYSYIWKHRSETLYEYSERCARAYHIPIFAPLIHDVTASILRSPPQRSDESPVWREFWSDADGAGTDIGALIRHSLASAFVFGRSHVLVDRPALGQASSRGAELVLGDRPYCQIVTPLDIVDWRLDDRGNYEWVVIREFAPDERAPGIEMRAQTYRYRVWTRDRWELYARRGGASMPGIVVGATDAWDMIASAPHAFGAVPLADLYTARVAGRREMDCESPFASQLDVDRHVLNELSELWETDRTQAFSLLAIPIVDGQSGSPIDLGPARAFGYLSGAGAPQYVSPDASLTERRWERVRSKIREARAAAGIGRGIAEESKEQRSAEAIVEEMRGQLSQMAEWAVATQEFDWTLHRLVAVGYGMAPSSAPVASYVRSFYRTALLAAVNVVNQIRASSVLPAQTIARMVAPVVRAYLADFGSSLGELDAADAEIAQYASSLRPTEGAPMQRMMDVEAIQP